jgi:hypothetical protein
MAERQAARHDRRDPKTLRGPSFPKPFLALRTKTGSRLIDAMSNRSLVNGRFDRE